MKKVIILFLILGFYSCAEKKQESKLKGFDLITDFEENEFLFERKLYGLENHSTDGGQLVIYSTTKKDYMVLDFWLIGETGKLNYTYWTDSKFKHKFIKQVDYDYDKPYYMEDYKIDTIINYFSYEDATNKLFDKNMEEVINTELVKSAKEKLESFFNEVTEDITIE